MASPKNFVAGFNHNIKHRGQVYHVQTEDSGEEAAVITTHLFLGGTILATRRDAYAELRGTADLARQVRARMEAQHKQLLRDLVNGKVEGLGENVPSYQPGELAVAPAAPPPPAAPASTVHEARTTRIDTGLVGSLAAARAAAQAGKAAGGRSTVLDAEARATLREVAIGEGRITPGPAEKAAAPAPRRASRVDTGVAAAAAPADPRATRVDTDVAAAAAPADPRATRIDNGVATAAAPADPRATRIDTGIAAAAPSADPRATRFDAGLPPAAPARKAATPVLTHLPAFGADLISDRSLDQVILAYLAESDEG